MKLSLLCLLVAVTTVAASGCTIAVQIDKEDLKEVVEEVESERGWFDWLRGE